MGRMPCQLDHQFVDPGIGVASLSPRSPGSPRAERIPVEQIPNVDFTPFRTGDSDRRKQAALELAGAFRNVGFAYLAGHGVDQELIDRTSPGGRFFALPREKKAEVAVEKSNCDRRWFDIGMENLDPDK